MSILSVGGVVSKIRAGVKIIVQMDTIHRVVFQGLLYAIGHQLAHLGQGRVKIQFSVVKNHQRGVFPGRMGFRKGLEAGFLGFSLHPLGHPVRVDPGVDLHAIFMGLLCEIGQGIEAIQWGLALFSCEIAAAREDGGRVQSIGTGPHLKEDAVQSSFPGVLQNGVQFLLHLLRRQAGGGGEVQIGNGGDEHPTQRKL